MKDRLKFIIIECDSSEENDTVLYQRHDSQSPGSDKRSHKILSLTQKMVSALLFDSLCSVTGLVLRGMPSTMNLKVQNVMKLTVIYFS